MVTSLTRAAVGGAVIPRGKARLKAVIDEHLHREGLSPRDLVIEVDDRVAEGGRRAIPGSALRGAHGGFVDLEDGGRVPFHKVRRVLSGTTTVYAREPAR